MNDIKSLCHSVWDCKYHVVFIPKCRRRVIYGNVRGEHFWARGYFVSTVGRDEDVVRDYIRRQEEEDRRIDQLGRELE